MDIKLYKFTKNVPKDKIFVAESGINSLTDIKMLKSAHVDAVLIGEALMKSNNKKENSRLFKGGKAVTKIKICGITKLQDIDVLNVIGVDFAGFVFAKSPRQSKHRNSQNLKIFFR